MKKIDLSIIIVTFNNQDVIQDCLSSTSSHLGSLSTELFLIDNNSSDETIQILSEDWNAFSRVHRIYNETNRGYTRAVNQGLKSAGGDYILMLNPDVIIPDDIFPELFALLNEKIAVVAPQLRFPDGRIQPSCRRFPQKRDVFFEFLGLAKFFPKSDLFNRWRMPQFDHKSSQLVHQPQGAFLLTTRAALEKTGLLDEQFYMFFSDVEWCKRIYEKGMHIFFDAGHFVYHVQGASVKKNRRKMIITSHHSFIQYFCKYDKSFGQKLTTVFVSILLFIATIPRILCTLLPKSKR